MIHAVIFDCFGVLYTDYGLAFYEKYIPNYYALRHDIMQVDKQADYGLITAEEHDKQIAALAGLDYEFVHTNIKGVHARNEPLLAYIMQLRSKYKIGMLSNVSAGGLDEFFSAKEQQSYFDTIVVSGDVGMIKPSQDIFAFTVAQLGLQPEECVMVDDRIGNVEGAERAGMKAILHTSNHDTIYQLRELGILVDA